jgi:hypothetical protein
MNTNWILQRLAVGSSDWLGLSAVFCIGFLAAFFAVQFIAYKSWQIREPGVHHIAKFSKYLHLFFVYLLSEFRIKLGLSAEKTELLFQKLFLEAVGQGGGEESADHNSANANKEGFHRPNENKLSDRRRERASLRLKLF